MSRTEARKKGAACFAVFNCATKGREKRYVYPGRIVARQGNQVDMHWEANRRMKTYSSGDVHAFKLVALAIVMKKDSACSPAKDAPQPASLGEVSPTKDEDATPALVFVKVGRKQLQVPSCYGGRLKFD